MARGRHGSGLDFTPPIRGMLPGMHDLLAILPGVLGSPALPLVGSDRFPGEDVIRGAKVLLSPQRGFCWVDESVPCIVLTMEHYLTGSDLDLYLDLLHEATHLRQILEGRDVWDEAYPYQRRPTEIEGYAVAVSECRRLGLDEQAVRAHLANPWMTDAAVEELLAGIEVFLAGIDRSRAVSGATRIP